MISRKKSIISEPKVLISGVEGAGKTLFAIQQADLLAQEEGGDLFQLNIRDADPGHLPKLPFDLTDMAYDEDGKPVVDEETGDHLPKWATLTPGTVILVDEAHKVFPQRGPGRPPKHIEMLAEGRQFGIRFVLISQSPSSIDGFLRDRISRHYQVERKGNMERATILEFDHCVMFPRTAWQQRKDAQVHFWSYPKEYYGWYKSAKVHSFKVRIPWKIWAALAFIPIAGFVAWQVIDKVGGVMDGGGILAGAAASDAIDGIAELGGSDRVETTTDVQVYLERLQPLVQTHPWSAPIFQGRQVQAEPQLYCMQTGAGINGKGEYTEGRCSCFTEQVTRYSISAEGCESIVRAGGVYNPYKAPVQLAGGHAKPGEARLGPSGVHDPQPPPMQFGGTPAVGYGGMARYGGMGSHVSQ